VPREAASQLASTGECPLRLSDSPSGPKPAAAAAAARPPCLSLQLQWCSLQSSTAFPGYCWASTIGRPPAALRCTLWSVGLSVAPPLSLTAPPRAAACHGPRDAAAGPDYLYTPSTINSVFIYHTKSPLPPASRREFPDRHRPIYRDLTGARRRGRQLLRDTLHEIR